jgi:hypothetical protein
MFSNRSRSSLHREDGMSEEIIPKIARSIYEGRNGRGCRSWGGLPKAHQEPYLRDALAVIEALTRDDLVGLLSGLNLAAFDDLRLFPSHSLEDGMSYLQDYYDTMWDEGGPLRTDRNAHVLLYRAWKVIKRMQATARPTPLTDRRG